jgi:hypothetical protein
MTGPRHRSLKDHAGFCRQAAVSCEAQRFLLWHRAATGRVDRRRTIPKDRLTAADIEPMTLSPELTHDLRLCKGIDRRAER